MIPAFLLVHTATVRAFLGSGARGEVLGEPQVGIPCYFEDIAEIVTDPDGRQIIKGGFVAFNIGACVCPPRSEITVNGATGRAKTVAVLDDNGITGLAHVEVDLE